MIRADPVIRAAKTAHRDQVQMEKRAAKAQRQLQRQCFWSGPRWGHVYELVIMEMPSPTSAVPERTVTAQMRQCKVCHKQVI